MTERLEEIKTRFNAMKELESFKKLAPTDLFFDDLNWLLQQAERVEELEKELNGTKYRLGYKQMFAQCNRDYASLNYEKDRYKQALENTKGFLERMEKGQSLERPHYVGYNLIEALNTINKALEREG